MTQVTMYKCNNCGKLIEWNSLSDKRKDLDFCNKDCKEEYNGN